MKAPLQERTNPRQNQSTQNQQNQYQQQNTQNNTTQLKNHYSEGTQHNELIQMMSNPHLNKELHQFKTMMPHYPQIKAQSDIMQMMHNSSSVQELRQFKTMMYNSPKIQQEGEFIQRMQKNALQNGFLAQLKAIGQQNQPLQKVASEEEELLQGKFQNQPIQQQEETVHRPPSTVHRENNTGLPDNLKTGIENLSGYSMDDVKVHYNSSKPAQLQAHAYAQGTDIHLAPGQEKHLPHEAWHVVQQKQGRVKPTLQMKGGVNVNDDVRLEREADVMGEKSLQAIKNYNHDNKRHSVLKNNNIIQGWFSMGGRNFTQVSINRPHDDDDGLREAFQNLSNTAWQRVQANAEFRLRAENLGGENTFRDYLRNMAESIERINYGQNNYNNLISYVLNHIPVDIEVPNFNLEMIQNAPGNMLEELELNGDIHNDEIRRRNSIILEQFNGENGLMSIRRLGGRMNIGETVFTMNNPVNAYVLGGVGIGDTYAAICNDLTNQLEGAVEAHNRDNPGDLITSSILAARYLKSLALDENFNFQNVPDHIVPYLKKIYTIFVGAEGIARSTNNLSAFILAIDQVARGQGELFQKLEEVTMFAQTRDTVLNETGVQQVGGAMLSKLHKRDDHAILRNHEFYQELRDAEMLLFIRYAAANDIDIDDQNALIEYRRAISTHILRVFDGRVNVWR